MFHVFYVNSDGSSSSAIFNNIEDYQDYLRDNDLIAVYKKSTDITTEFFWYWNNINFGDQELVNFWNTTGAPFNDVEKNKLFYKHLGYFESLEQIQKEQEMREKMKKEENIKFINELKTLKEQIKLKNWDTTDIDKDIETFSK